MAGSRNDDELDEEAEDRERDLELDRGRKQLDRGRIARMTEKLTGGPERPGEQKVGKSPVVLLLVGSTVGASILAAIFWYINGRTKEERLLKEAVAFLDEQKYLDAEDKFANFLKLYPKTASTPVATIGLNRTLIEKHIMSQTPDVAKGLEAFETFRRDCAELPGFEDQRKNMYGYALRTAFAGARVAELTQDRAPLDVSKSALKYMGNYAEEGGIPPTDEQRIVNLQTKAELAIAKKERFQSTLAGIKQQLDSGNTLAAIQIRQELLTEFPLLADDKDIVKSLQDILAREKEFTTVSQVSRDATVPAAGAQPTASMALSLRTQAATDLTSQGRAIFCVGIDSCYAIDADTGAPIWRRAIGGESPFAPMAVKTTTEPGVLVFNTLTNMLQMLAQQDGRVIWEQSCEGVPTAVPLLTTDMAYVATDQKELWQVSLSNGRALSKLRFTQDLIGPAAISSDGQTLVLAGDDTLVYTISVTPFECKAVSYVPHQAGSVKGPILASGKNYVLCDNHTIEQARVQTLAIAESGQLSVIATDIVDGQVENPMLLRGYELFVPSSPQRVTAFRVADEPGQPPLARVGANQLEDSPQTVDTMFLLAGPGGQLWLAGRDLRKFETRTNTVMLEDSKTAEGIHVRPIQFSDQDVFLTTRAFGESDGTSSIFMTRADREQMKGIWRTVLGTRIVALAEATGGQSVLVVADYGKSYRVNLDEIAKGGFALEAVSEFRLPDKLMSPVNGFVLPDGRPAAWCGGDEPAMWTFTTTGQLERRWQLIAAPVPNVSPVTLDVGVVFAMPGRLHLTGLSGGKTVADYQSAQTGGNASAWKSLTAISGTQVLAVTSDNQFVRVEYRAAPRPQLAEVGVTRFPHSVEVAPAAADGFVSAATVEGKLLLLQGSTLEVLAETELGGVTSVSPMMAGGLVFVNVANQQMKVFRVDGKLTPTAAIPLDGYSLAGPPLVLQDGSFIAGRSDGLLMRLDKDGVPTGVQKSLGQELQIGPRRLNDAVVVTGADGSLYRVDPELNP